MPLRAPGLGIAHGPHAFEPDVSFLPAGVGLGTPVRKAFAMTELLIAGAALSALLFFYLGFALLYPEKLS